MRHFHRVTARELFNDQQEIGAVICQRIPDQGLVVLHHVRHIHQAHRTPLARGGEVLLRLVDQQRAGALHRHFGQTLRRDDGRDVLDSDPLLGCVNKAGVAGRGRLHEAQRRNPQRIPD